MRFNMVFALKVMRMNDGNIKFLIFITKPVGTKGAHVETDETVFAFKKRGFCRVCPRFAPRARFWASLFSTGNNRLLACELAKRASLLWTVGGDDEAAAGGSRWVFLQMGVPQCRPRQRTVSKLWISDFLLLLTCSRSIYIMKPKKRLRRFYFYSSFIELKP